MNCVRLLPPGLNLKLLLHRQSDEFSILAGSGKYRINVLDLKLDIRKIKVSPAALVKHAQLFENQEAFFPIHQTKITTNLIPSGITSQSFENIVRGPLPQQILLFMVADENYSGKTSKNPFFFQNFSVNKFAFKVNGETHPSSLFNPNFSNGDYMREYANFMDVIGIAAENSGNDITPQEFADSCTVFALDLSADTCNSFHTHILSNGVIGIEMSFSKPLEKPIQVLTYQIYHKVLRVDKDRVTKLEYLV